MHLVGRDIEHIASVDQVRGPGALGLGFTFNNVDLVLVIVAVQWGVATGLYDKVTHREVRSQIVSTDHDLHGHALGALHLDSGCGSGIGMADKHDAQVLRLTVWMNQEGLDLSEGWSWPLGHGVMRYNTRNQ